MPVFSPGRLHLELGSGKIRATLIFRTAGRTREKGLLPTPGTGPATTCQDTR